MKVMENAVAVVRFFTAKLFIAYLYRKQIIASEISCTMYLLITAF